MNDGSTRTRKEGHSVGRTRSVRDTVGDTVGAVQRAIRRSSTLSREGGTSGYVRVRTEMNAEEKKALKDIRIPEHAWKENRKRWVRRAKRLSQVDGMDEAMIPGFFLRTALLCQFMNNSLLVFYRQANPDGTQLCKLIEYEEESINVFTLTIRKEDEVSNLFSDYFDYHNVIAIGGKITINKLVEDHHGTVREKVFRQYII